MTPHDAAKPATSAKVSVHFNDGRTRTGVLLTRTGDKITVIFDDNGQEETITLGKPEPRLL